MIWFASIWQILKMAQEASHAMLLFVERPLFFPFIFYIPGMYSLLNFRARPFSQWFLMTLLTMSHVVFLTDGVYYDYNQPVRSTIIWILNFEKRLPIARLVLLIWDCLQNLTLNRLLNLFWVTICIMQNVTSKITTHAHLFRNTRQYCHF